MGHRDKRRKEYDREWREKRRTKTDLGERKKPVRGGKKAGGEVTKADIGFSGGFRGDGW